MDVILNIYFFSFLKMCWNDVMLHILSYNLGIDGEGVFDQHLVSLRHVNLTYLFLLIQSIPSS